MAVVEENEFIKPGCFAQPKCTSPLDHKYAFVAGICNNPIDRNRGRVGRSYKRLLPADYGDDKGKPRLAKDGQSLPSARNISMSLNLNDHQTRSRKISRMMPWWGQFVTHEITKALRGRKPSGATFSCSCDKPDDGCHNIPLSKDDVRYIQEAETCIEVERTQNIPDPECDSSIREQKNFVSSYLDAGTVYGDAESDFDQLLDRKSKIGELLVGNYIEKGLDAGLPFQSQVHRDFGGRVQCEVMIHKPPAKPCMLAGDTRANENTVLSAAHVVLLRKHNMIVKKLKELNPTWDRITLAQEAKKIITATMQLVTYQDFLPVVLGDKYMKRFNLDISEKGYWYGYDASVDATLSNSFGAAAFRFGHTTLTKFISRPAPDWRTPEADPLRVKDSFFNNEPLLEQFHGGVNSVIRGLARDATQVTGTKMVEDLREFLFAEPGHPGKDLFAINVQRGRDHGIPGYNDFRELCGLKRASDFSDMPEIPENMQKQLASLYKHVDDIDLYVGGLAETIVLGAAVGPTYACVIGYQFRDLRYGDKFWFENHGIFSSFSSEQLQSIKKYSLARLLCDTMSDLRTIQPKPLMLASVRGNARKFCEEFSPLDLQPWKENSNSKSRLERDYGADTDWSVWLPCVNDEGDHISVATALNDALKFRSEDVCRDIISSETRTVNSITQARFECPRGSIRRTDYPYIDSGYEVYWTPWRDDSDPGAGGDDVENPPDPNECRRPLSIQVQTIDGTPASETGDVFEAFGTDFGFVCRGEHQLSRSCKDYRVRYMCRRRSTKIDAPPSRTPPTKSTKTIIKASPEKDSKEKTKSTATTQATTTTPKKKKDRGDPEKLVWTPWSNADTPSADGDKELVSDVADKIGFCKNPMYMVARVVGDHTAAENSGNVLDEMSHRTGLICLNSKQSQGICKDFEVRYICRNGDINVEEDPIPEGVTDKAKEFCQSYGVCC